MNYLAFQILMIYDLLHWKNAERFIWKGLQLM